jgi:uncharacterized protein (DUF1697 family)
MKAYVAALLRAINVGGTGKLPMTALVELCEAAGLAQVRTYIASGNVVFHSDRSEEEIRSTLEDRLHAYAGKSVGVVVRSAAEIAGVVARNPYPDAPGNRAMALFVDGLLPSDPFDGVTGATSEQMCLGKRELYVLYPNGMAKTRLRIPSEKIGTARNINTVAKLAEMARALG